MHHTHSSQFFECSIYVSNSQPVKARWQDKCLLSYRTRTGLEVNFLVHLQSFVSKIFFRLQTGETTSKFFPFVWETWMILPRKRLLVDIFLTCKLSKSLALCEFASVNFEPWIWNEIGPRENHGFHFDPSQITSFHSEAEICNIWIFFPTSIFPQFHTSLPTSF